jgi:hypothetical protein
MLNVKPGGTYRNHRTLNSWGQSEGYDNHKERLSDLTV